MTETSASGAGLAPAVTIDGKGPVRLDLGMKDVIGAAHVYVTAESAADLPKEPLAKIEKVTVIVIVSGTEIGTRTGLAIARAAPAPRAQPTSPTPRPGSRERSRSASRKPRPI